MNTIQKMITAIVIGSSVLTGCATVEKMDKPTYDRLQAKARAALDKSDSVQNSWTTAEDALEKAGEAATNGDWETAIKQVKRSHEQSELAYQQYEQQKSNAPVYD